MPDQDANAPVTLALRLSAETPFAETLDMDISVTNNAGLSQNFWGKTPVLQISLPFHNGPGDDYNIVVQVDGYRNAGGFVHADPKVHPTLNLLMIPSNATLSFPPWAELKVQFPAAAGLIAATVSDGQAESRYLALGQQKPLSLASLLNLSAAMNDLGLGGGKTPVDFIRQIIWDDSLAQDRFFRLRRSRHHSTDRGRRRRGRVRRRTKPGGMASGRHPELEADPVSLFQRAAYLSRQRRTPSHRWRRLHQDRTGYGPVQRTGRPWPRRNRSKPDHQRQDQPACCSCTSLDRRRPKRRAPLRSGLYPLVIAQHVRRQGLAAPRSPALTLAFTSS